MFNNIKYFIYFRAICLNIFEYIEYFYYLCKEIEI